MSSVLTETTDEPRARRRSGERRGMRWAAAKARALPREQRRLAAEALIWLGLARTATVVLPFRTIAALLGLTAQPAAAEAPTAGAGTRGRAAAASDVAAIGWAVRAAAAATPWHSTCLAQALAGYVMLRRRKVPGTLYFGVAHDRDGSLLAHSWLRSEGRVLTGADEHARYTVIASYQRDPARYS